MAVSVRTRGHHRRTRPRRLSALFVLGLIGGLGWVFFFSSIFAVADVRVSGAAYTGDGVVADSIRALLAQKRLYVLQPKRNIFLLDDRAVGQYLIEQFASIEKATVTKKYPHGLEVGITERQTLGTWCRGDDCQFFDRFGIRWGTALPSHGPLLLLVRDERTEEDLDPRIFAGMLAAMHGLPVLGLAAASISLPDDEPGGIRLKTTKGYELYLDALGDVADQLDVLGVFLADRSKDPTFAPAYIDLRTPGRVYYK
jgi:cell division septal protein FtsQ